MACYIFLISRSFLALLNAGDPHSLVLVSMTPLLIARDSTAIPRVQGLPLARAAATSLLQAIDQLVKYAFCPYLWNQCSITTLSSVTLNLCPVLLSAILPYVSAPPALLYHGALSPGGILFNECNYYSFEYFSTFTTWYIEDLLSITARNSLQDVRG